MVAQKAWLALHQGEGDAGMTDRDRQIAATALAIAADLRFIMRMPTPETGPFTLQQMAIDDYSEAIRAITPERVLEAMEKKG
jgi:hypothetical protein